MSKITPDDFQLTHVQLNELFDRYEQELELKFLVQDQRKKFLAQFKNIDG